MDLNAKWHQLLDKWDAFKASPVKTHAACVIAGIVIGAALAYR